MLTGLRLCNFKAFEELDITLKPITLFLGPNNSGKSSILASLRLLAQTVTNNDPSIPLLFKGVMGDFGTYQDIVFRNQVDAHLKIGLSVQPNNQVDLVYQYQPEQRRVLLDKTIWQLNKETKLKTSFLEDNARAHQIDEVMNKQVSNARVLLDGFFPQYGLDPRDYPRDPTQELVFQEVNRVVQSFRLPLRSIEYIGPIRSYPQRTYQFAGSASSRIGTTGENAVGILEVASLQGEGKSILDSTNDWLMKAGIASDVRIETLTDRHYEVRVQHPQTKEYQNLVDVGMGGSQILPVLVGGFRLGEGFTYLIEEPEIHLHPRAQAKLGDFFLTLYQRRVQSLVETHSEHVVVGLQQHVAAGKIPPNDICVYYVYPVEGEKKAKALYMDEFGRFIGEWPEGFFPEGLQEAEELSRIRFQAKRRAQNGISH